MNHIELEKRKQFIWLKLQVFSFSRPKQSDFIFAHTVENRVWLDGIVEYILIGSIKITVSLKDYQDLILKQYNCFIRMPTGYAILPWKIETFRFVRYWNLLDLLWTALCKWGFCTPSRMTPFPLSIATEQNGLEIRRTTLFFANSMDSLTEMIKNFGGWFLPSLCAMKGSKKGG